MRPILFCLLLLGLIKAEGQSGLGDGKTYLPNLVPPTPEAYSLGKFGQNSIQLSTGSLTYSLPIYTIKTGDFDFPLTISYNSNGVKVDEVASRIGIQWKMDFGGVINRQINGVPDDINDGGVKFPTDSASQQFYNGLLATTQGPTFKAYQPDILSYNAPGISGKFYIRKQSNGTFEVIQLPQTNNKIVTFTDAYGQVRFDYFKIISPTGIEYTFGENNAYDLMMVNTNYSEALGFSSSEFTVKNAIYLTKIQFTNGTNIQLQYQTIGGAGSEIIFASGINQSFINHKISAPPNFHPGTSLNTTCQINSYEAAILNKIIFVNGTIDFVYSGREDIINERKLDKLIIKDINNAVKHETTFQYVYSNNSNASFFSKKVELTQNYQEILPALCKRLFLQTVTNTTNGNNTKFSFEYDDINALPPRLSFAQDYWGFFNGVQNQNTLFAPAYTPIATLNMAGEEFGANRIGNFSFAKKGILKKITYPTGGFTEYEVEPTNSFISWKPTYQEINYNVTVQPNVSYTTSTFSLENQSLNKLYIVPSTVPYPSDPENSWQGVSYDTTMTVNIKNSSNQIVYQFTISIFQPYYNPIINILYGGTYTIEIIHSYNYPVNVNFTIYKKLTTVFQSPSAAEGVKVSTIKDWDALGNISNLRKFKYSWVNTAIANGIANNPNIAEGLFYSNSFEPVFENAIPIVAKVHSNSQYSIYNSDFGNLPFEKVVEEYYDKNNILTGGFEYLFKVRLKDKPVEFGLFAPVGFLYYNPNTSILTDTIYYFKMRIPGSFATNNDLSNGLELETASFIINSTGQKKYKSKKRMVYSIDNAYKTSNQFYSVLPLSPTASQFISQKYFSNFVVNSNKVITYWEHLDSIIEQNFDDNDRVMTNVKTFAYKSPYHLFPTRETTLNSSGELMGSVKFYPSDITGNSIYNSMKQLNIISPIVIAIDSNLTNNKQINYIEYTYNNWNGQFKPITIAVKKANNPLNIVARYHSYDNFGNPTSYSKENDVITSIIYGYNNQYVVAKVEGSSYSNAIAASGGLNLTLINNPLTNDSQMRTELNKLRSLPNTFVTTYTYAPLVGVTSVTDANNRTMYYEYDAVQRLQRIKDQDGNILKQYEYQYQTCTAPFTNSVRSQSYVKSNCPNGFVGGRGTYIIQAGKHNSCNSAGEVETMVQNDFTANGQLFVNNNSSTSCSPLSYTFTVSPGWTSYYSTPLSAMSDRMNATFVIGATVSSSFDNIRNGIGVKVGTISGNCLPAVDRTVFYNASGAIWLLTVKTNGELWLKLASSTSLPPLNYPIQLTNGTYYL